MSDPTRPDLLDRFARLGLKAGKFESQFGLPAQLLSSMRKGKYRTPASATTIAKLEAALAAVEESMKGGQVIAEQHTRNKVVRDETVEQELMRMIDDANDPAKWEALQKRILKARLSDTISDSFVRVFNDTYARAQTQWKEQRKVDAELASGEPVEVVVTLVNDWKEGE